MTMRARLSEKFSPSDSLAPTTASSSAPFALEGVNAEGYEPVPGTYTTNLFRVLRQ